MFHNINGLSLHGNEGLDMFTNDQQNLDIDIQGITEHCLDTTKYEVYQTAQDIVRRHAQSQALLTLHSAEESALNLYKPGGTGFLLLGDIVSRLETNGVSGDSLGRWSTIHFRRRDQPPLTIITAYQVCTRPTNLLGNTAYHQQVRGLSRTAQPNIHPRQAFIRDLERHISTLQSRGHDIILGGDFNESLDDRNSGILRLITSRNLTDPYLHRFPHTPTFGTHIKGQRRIDMVFMSTNLLPTVQNLGYAPYHFSKPSDHRPLVIELNTQLLFGYKVTLPTSQHRTLKTKDKAAVKQFITQWFQEITAQQGFALQRQLDDDSASPDLVEQIDTLIGTSGKKAEASCRRRRKEFYSQDLVQQRIIVSTLRHQLNSLRIGVDRSPQLVTRLNRFGMNPIIPTTIREAKAMLSLATHKLEALRRDHAELRQQELTAKIDIAVERGHRHTAQAIRAIKTAESNIRTYQILRNIKKRSDSSQQLDRIEIPNSWPPFGTSHDNIANLEDPKTCTAWRLVTVPSEIEYYLLLRNRLHFGQAEGTPFTRPPLSNDFDWGATTEAANQLLQGTYSGTVATENLQEVLRACRQATEQDSLPAELHRDEFKGKIRSWKESTTTSPSGRHLGWYKSLFVTMPQTESPEESQTSEENKQPFQAMQETIASLLLSVINYCIRNTYVLDRWRKIINVMIFKEHGNYKIHRLRVIHLYEADFNLLLAVKWRQLLRTADRQSLIHEGQYGGRPGCEAQSLTFLEELKYDLAHLTRRTLFNFDNDAMSCYDRIVIPLASIINRKYGLHRHVVAVHAKTLQSARYYLKTASGVSDAHYSPCRRYPIHGSGQGSGNSPAIWLFISSTLFDIHSSQAFGAQFYSPDGHQHVRFSMVGFVDDSTGTCNDFQPQCESPISVLLQRMQSDAQLWNNLLYCTGGKLELTKCSFHVLQFDFRPNGTPVPSIASYENKIKISDSDCNRTVPIHSKRAFDPHRTLGHLKSPVSGSKKALQILKEKADHIALLITISPLHRQGAYLAYHTVYIPSVRYTLPQSFFTSSELEKSQASSLPKIIAKCGFNRHIARAILFGPRHFGGGGFLPWHALQGEGQIMLFLKHWRTSTVISKTLQIAVTWAQWQSGHPYSIFEDVSFPLPYLECRWLTSLRSFLSHINGTIVFDSPLIFPPERAHDIYIMHFARKCGLFSNHELAILNYCRLYLHITTVSELLDSSGTKIIPALHQCRREPWFNPETYVTLQRRPSEYQIRYVWQKLCHQWVTSSGHLGLSHNLGPWKTSGHQLRRRRESYATSPSGSCIYHWHQGSYWELRQDEIASNIYHMGQPTTWTPTSLCFPIDVKWSSDTTLTVLTRPRPICRPQRHPTPRTFHAYVQSLESWERFLLEGINLVSPPFELVSQIHRQGTSHEFLAVSDGSVKSDNITYGWVFGNAMGKMYACHSGWGSGTPTSFRAEAWGMLSVASFLHHLHLFTQASFEAHSVSPKISFISDNLGLVTRVTQRLSYDVPYPNSTLSPDWDIVEQIVSTISKLSFASAHINWVKGHQDDTTTDLSVSAQFNVLADQLATTAHLSRPHLPLPFVILPSAKCSLVINARLITSQYQRAIREEYTLPRYKLYIEERHEWRHGTTDVVDWPALQRAIRSSTIPHIQLVKLIHDKLPTNYELAKSVPGQSKSCHYCSCDETFHHLLRCSNKLSASFRSDICSKLAAYMETRMIPKSFRSIFLTQFRQSLESSKPTLNEQSDNIHDQTTLGPKAFLHGYLHVSWRDTLSRLLSRYSDSVETTSLDSITGIIKIIWAEQLRFWDHHLKAQHQGGLQTTPSVSNHRSQYQHRIRHLYSQREKCLPGHQDKYFPENIEDFLSSSHTHQLKQYLFHYESLIRRSISLAKQIPHRLITSFPGFVRRRIPPATPPALGSTHGPPSNSMENTMGVRGAPVHHKHTRWKVRTSIQNSIRTFFSIPAAPD